MKLIQTLIALLLLAAVMPANAQGQGSAELIEKFEARLLGARLVSVEARIVASGAVSAALVGKTVLRLGNRASYSYSGTFNDKRVDLAFESDGLRFSIRNGDEKRTGAVGVASNHALLLGMTRMGLLHNIARGTSLDGPDHSFGSVEKWITLDGFLPTTFAQAGERAGQPSFGFDLLVNGFRSAGVRIWMDSATGLPNRREQLVNFPSGEMRVVETYSSFTVE